MKKKIMYAIVLAMAPLFLSAQEDVTPLFYRDYMNLINPAFVGASDHIDFGVNVRSQNANVKGAPELQSFVLGIPMGSNVGLGLSGSTGKTFIERQTTISADFSYKLTLDRYGRSLYFGLKAGFGSYSANTSGLTTFGITADPLLQNIDTGLDPNFGAGFLYRDQDNFYVAFSMPRILNYERLSGKDGIATLSPDKIPLYLSGGMRIDLGGGIAFKPSILMRYAKALTFFADFNAMFDLGKYFDLGASYRYDQSYAGMFMFKAGKSLRVGYAYETAQDRSLGSVSKGTHEVVLKLNL